MGCGGCDLRSVRGRGTVGRLVEIFVCCTCVACMRGVLWAYVRAWIANGIFTTVMSLHCYLLVLSPSRMRIHPATIFGRSAGYALASPRPLFPSHSAPNRRNLFRTTFRTTPNANERVRSRCQTGAAFDSERESAALGMLDRQWTLASGCGSRDADLESQWTSGHVRKDLGVLASA
jgi:hypothetical protein